MCVCVTREKIERDREFVCVTREKRAEGELVQNQSILCVYIQHDSTNQDCVGSLSAANASRLALVVCYHEAIQRPQEQ